MCCHLRWAVNTFSTSHGAPAYRASRGPVDREPAQRDHRRAEARRRVGIRRVTSAAPLPDCGGRTIEHVTVVVPAHDEAQHIDRCLTSVVAAAGAVAVEVDVVVEVGHRNVGRLEIGRVPGGGSRTDSVVCHHRRRLPGAGGLVVGPARECSELRAPRRPRRRPGLVRAASAASTPARGRLHPRERPPARPRRQPGSVGSGIIVGRRVRLVAFGGGRRRRRAWRHRSVCRRPRPAGSSSRHHTWKGSGMARSRTGAVTFDGVPAERIGGRSDYLERAGFWHGAIGVAACWLGGAERVADTLRSAARARPLDPHALAHLGTVDAALAGARWTMEGAAAETDRPPDLGAAHLRALRVRAVIEAAAGLTVDRVGRALGPAPPLPGRDPRRHRRRSTRPRAPEPRGARPRLHRSSCRGRRG